MHPAFHAHGIGGGGVMFSERVGSLMERENLLTAPPETTVSAAALLMARRKVGAVMVTRDEKLVGFLPSAMWCSGSSPLTLTLKAPCLRM